MKEWINEKIDYLHRSISRVPSGEFLFEPGKEFYDTLEKIDVIPPYNEFFERFDKGEKPFITFDAATDSIAKHLGRPIPPIKFHSFEYSTNQSNIAGKIEVGGASRDIYISSDYKMKARQLGTILSHEIAHDVLYSNGITLPDTYENEKLTDLTAIMLGLGKLFLNGMEERTGAMTKKLCYLSFSDIAYAYVTINARYNVPTDKYFPNLTRTARYMVESFVNETNVEMARSMLESVKERCLEVKNVKYSIDKIYCQIVDNQELLNKNAGSIEITLDDSKIFVYLNSFSFHQDFESHISHMDGKISNINRKLGDEWKYTSINTIQNTLQRIKGLDLQINQIEKEMNRYLGQLFEMLSVQEKYFPKRSDTLVKRFVELIEEGKIKDALKMAEKEDVKLLNILGIKFAKKKDPLALEIFDKAIKLNPADAVSYYNRGNMHRTLNRRDIAIDDYTEAIRLNPSYANAYINRGNVYFNLKLYLEAVSDYTKSIEIDSVYAAHLNRGRAYLHLKQYSEAIDDFQTSIKLDPGDHVARDNLKETFDSLKRECGMAIYVKTVLLDWIKRI